MERVQNKLSNVTLAYNECVVVRDRLEHPRREYDSVDIRVYQTTFIKLFELFFEALWKLLKAYFQDVHGIKVLGSKDVLRKCVEFDLLAEPEAQVLLAAVDDRNFTVHEYSLALAGRVSQSILKDYLPAAEKLYERSKSLLEQSGGPLAS